MRDESYRHNVPKFKLHRFVWVIQRCSRNSNSHFARNLLATVYNGYSDILEIVILLSLSIFPHLHIRHTKFIGYGDTMVIVIIWP